jgi:hypothetical protein
MYQDALFGGSCVVPLLANAADGNTQPRLQGAGALAVRLLLYQLLSIGSDKCSGIVDSGLIIRVKDRHPRH